MRNFLGWDSSLLWTGDLVETFNYLIGLRVKHTAATVGYYADFGAHAAKSASGRFGGGLIPSVGGSRTSDRLRP